VNKNESVKVVAWCGKINGSKNDKGERKEANEIK
jgi:hypothetical protein